MIQNFSSIIDYDFKALIMGEIDFFKGPYKKGQCLSYPISGLFVKYLIDTYGIDRTIEFYKERDLEIAFQNAFDKKIDMIISDWKQWLIMNRKITMHHKTDGHGLECVNASPGFSGQ